MLELQPREEIELIQGQGMQIDWVSGQSISLVSSPLICYVTLNQSYVL